MGIPKIALCETHLGLMNKGPLNQTIYGTMVLLISSCWFYIMDSLFFIVRILALHIFRIRVDDNSQKDDSCVLGMKVSKDLGPVPEATEMERDYSSSSEEETSNLSFKFQYQFEGLANPLVTNANSPSETTEILKYSFLPEKYFSGFIEEPNAMTLSVQESYSRCSEDYNDGKEKLGNELTTGFLLAKNFQQFNEFGILNQSKESEDGVLEELLLEEEMLVDSKTNSSDENGSGGFMEEPEITTVRVPFMNDEDKLDSELIYRTIIREESEDTLSKDSLLVEELPMTLDRKEALDRFKFLSQSFSDFDSDIESLSDGYSVKDLVVDQDTDGFLSERDFEEHEDESVDSNGYETDQSGGGCVHGKNQSNYEDISNGFQPKRGISESENRPQKKLPRYLEIESTYSSDDHHSSFRTDTTKLSNSNETFLAKDRTYSEFKSQDLCGEGEGATLDLQCSDADKSCDDLESLWEHQFLIEQLKMELRKVRDVGLPTILEESESPKTSDDLKPWKIEENIMSEDPIDELHSFYRSYRERMRKFDILNYQKMYAIGFLQLKDPLQSIGSQKPLIPTIMAHVSQSLWPFARHKSGSDPSEKFLKELESDLETVYVGQTCLSWEFLRWQYEKARGLPGSDPYRSHQYNQVAGEFQQFQVIIQRFVENEAIQGPRLPNYVKNRCVLRNLLQVPVVKEDCVKDKMEEQRTITSEMLEDIMEESIRVYWEFVKADKNETPMVLKGLIGAHAELQDPSDFELMMDVQANLQKKEKKLKDIMRTGNCLVKKFKKPQEQRLNQDLFFSQVDLKLVSMVLRMSRIATEQLVWCHKKLNKITFTDRKIQRKPSFLLFPS